MNKEIIRKEATNPYVIICKKDGSSFMVFDSDCTIGYSDEYYDIITESDKEVAIAKLNLRTDNSSANETETKQKALLSIDKIDAKLNP